MRRVAEDLAVLTVALYGWQALVLGTRYVQSRLAWRRTRYVVDPALSARVIREMCR